MTIHIVNWLDEHPLFEALKSNHCSPRAWVVFAEAFAPLIYSVPAFLGITLAKANGQARAVLEDVWSEELGTKGTPSHPVLFEAFHRFVTKTWGSATQMHEFGVRAGTEMITLCGSGPWPIGVAAMLAHESQFPQAYGGILQSAKRDLGETYRFFELHSTVDVEHSSRALTLLDRAVNENLIHQEAIVSSYKSSADALRRVADRVWEELL